MKKIFILIALIAYVFSTECQDCLSNCEKTISAIHFVKRIDCNNRCYKGPCSGAFGN